MTRRGFLVAASLTPLVPRSVEVDAVVAPVLPSSIRLPWDVVRSLGDTAGLCEVRTYSEPNRDLLIQLQERMRLTGVACIKRENSLVLMFPTLEARAQAWVDVAAEVTGGSYEFAIYQYQGSLRSGSNGDRIALDHPLHGASMA